MKSIAKSRRKLEVSLHIQLQLKERPLKPSYEPDKSNLEALHKLVFQYFESWYFPVLSMKIRKLEGKTKKLDCFSAIP